MRVHKRMLCALVSGSMLASMLAPAGAAAQAAEPTAQGSISATVRVDFPQKLTALEARNVRGALYQGNKKLVEVPLYRESSAVSSGYPVQVSLRNKDGGELGGGEWPSYLDMSVDGLAPGTYTLKFQGNGYVPFEQQVKLEDYSRHVILGTGDATFSLGDVTGDGTITAADRTALSAALGSEQKKDLDVYDLNGDGEIDVQDLVYVNHQLKREGNAEVAETVLLKNPIDLAETQAELDGVTVTGELENLFASDGSVTFQHALPGTTIGEHTELVLPIVLSAQVETSELRVVTPEGAGEIQQGTVLVEGVDGSGTPFQEAFPFDTLPPEDVHALRAAPGSNVITISLGTRVAVKKITISVTKTEGGQFAVVENIQFLKDIVPENPVAPNSEVKNLKAEPGSGQVTLTWTDLPNVSGYKVEYWLENVDNAPKKELHVDVNRAVVSGLEDLKTYVFTVTPTDGSWEGRPCAPVTATPLPGKAPDKPDMVSVTPMDGALSVSWKQGKSATYYEVYYTDQENAPISTYQQAGGRLEETRTTITGLTNGTAYYLYVVAGNDQGKSGPSAIATGTPKAVDYSRPAGIPTQGILDSSKIESIRLAAPGNYDKNSYTADAPFKPENMIDGDYRTHWTANSWSRDEHVICTFREPVDLNAAFWVPRLDGSYPTNLRAYSVRVWYEGEDLNGEGHLLVPNPLAGGVDNGGTGSDVHTWPNLPNYSTVNTDRFAVLPFGPVKQVKQISLAVEQRDYLTVSLSELMFMEYDPEHCLPEDIDKLFTDSLRTQLAAGVDQTRIDALKARLESDERNYYLYPEVMEDELKLAGELLNSGASSGVILNGVESRKGTKDNAYGQGGSMLQPLGVAARAGQEITIYAEGIPAGSSLSIVATQFNAQASAWSATVGSISNGRNVLKVPAIGSDATDRGGSLYFTYSGETPENIQLHVRRAVDIPVLSLSNWYRLDNETARRDAISAYVDELTAYMDNSTITDSNKETHCLNVTEISTPTVLLSLPAKAVLDNTVNDPVNAIYNSILAWEDVMHICKTTQGITNTYADNDMDSRQNIRCMTMFEGAFMYAAGSHIGIGYGSCGGMVNGKPIDRNTTPSAGANSLFGWGIAHEIGHNMDKLGKAEITNNIYSIMVQTYDGAHNTLPSRLEKSNKYAGIFNKVALGYPGASNDVFVQLGMYWQLHLAYDGAGADAMRFYTEFFQAWKAGTYFDGAASYDDKVALTAAAVAGRDLTDFFTRWGMSLSEETQAKLDEYPGEDRAIWYFSDQSRRDILAGKTSQTGGLTVTAQVKAGADAQVKNNVELTITPSGLTDLQGYEIRRDGKPIDFVIPANSTDPITYTDVIGSANHRAYVYSVAAYDTLGAQVASGTADQVRVSYDKLVPADAYEMKRSGDTVTFEFTEPTPVSGLKLLGSSWSAGGDYTVSIQNQVVRESGTPGLTDPVIAQSGNFSAGNMTTDAGAYLTYFKMPGAPADDTRIWIYDAYVITVTGIPDTVAAEDIRLLSYAEDDISFLEGEQGTAGILGAELDVGDRVLPAGTLVVVGNYRSNPAFATIKLKGRFTNDALTGDEAGEGKMEERYLAGEFYLFATVPEDKQVSDISDGLFVFVPDVQAELDLQEKDPCTAVNVLPSMIQAELGRTDTATDASSQHTTATTTWIHSPGGAELPTIIIE
ncbi:M60 family metallopeptidase [Pseudoflavonifractor sp. 524-17]|uniref:M60 family metallopeptidase n=1 Tax=Pseudoflavonifractor sp. 524-17 TaxID=2304577 RepID=UPI00137B6582|nr:M60 family metallopeptidase [Pseudoflavonifractor sp. 524-17]